LVSLALSGVSVLADMVLVSTINTFRASLPLRDAILDAAESGCVPYDDRTCGKPGIYIIAFNTGG
jgi:hypothetical protein